jgi:DNA-binding NarL/FixJ family response regulator
MVVLSTRLQVDYIRRLFNGGVRSFIYRKGRMEEIVAAALRTLSQGEVYLSPEAAALPYLSQSMPTSLEERDLEVLHLLAKGYKVKEIARALEVNRKVIYRSREKLRRILQVGNNEQLVPAAITAGLLKNKTPHS